MRQLSLSLLMLFAVQAGSLSAADLYVNNKLGNDRSDGRGPQSKGAGGGPVRTIQRALQLSRKGDRVVLAKTDEPYRESITLHGLRNAGFSQEHPFIIEGNGAILDGSVMIPQDAWKHYRDNVFRYRPARLRHHMLFVAGNPADRVKPKGRGVPELKPLQWCLVDGYVYFRTDQNNLPSAYKMSHSVLPVGVTLYETRHVRIENLTVQGFRIDGVNAHDSVFDTILTAIRARGNGRSGISIGGASRVVVAACLVGNNGEAQIRTEGRSQARIINTDIVHQDTVKDIDQAKTTIVKREGKQ